MSDKPPLQETGQFWTPYVPDDKMPWNLLRVVHLHRRAGFAANDSETQHDFISGSHMRSRAPRGHAEQRRRKFSDEIASAGNY